MGSVAVAFSDKSGSGYNALLGDMLVIGSTVATATYMILYKRLMSDLSLGSVNILLGSIGIATLILFWPGIVRNSRVLVPAFSNHNCDLFKLQLVCDFGHWETFSLPKNRDTWTLFIASSITNILFNVTLNYGIFNTSPVFMRVATICSIPTSFFIDLIVFKVKLNWLRAFGALLIVFGFVVFSIVDLRGSRKKPATEEDELVLHINYPQSLYNSPELEGYHS